MRNPGWLAVVIACSATIAYAANSSAFLTKAIEGDNSEITLGSFAQTRASSQGVKNFGAMLQQDHTQAKQQAVAVAQAVGVSPPSQMVPAAVQEQRKLQGLSGKAFDHEFVRYMIQDHRKDIRDFQQEAAKHDGKASTLAQQQLPTLEKHLDTALGLAKQGV